MEALSFWFNKIKSWISIGITYFKQYWYLVFGLLLLSFFGSSFTDLFKTRKEEYEEEAKKKKEELKKINEESAHAIKKANKLAQKNEQINKEIEEAQDEYKKEEKAADTAADSINNLDKYW